MEEGEEDTGVKKLPTLEQFDAEIQKYRTIQEEVAMLPSNQAIMWLKVDDLTLQK